MRRIPAVVVAVVVLMWSVAARAQTPASQEPVVVVSGEGVVKVAPDQAWVTLATESRSKNPKEAQTQNAAAMTAVQQKLTGAGIPKDAIRTVSYDLQLESDWVNGRQVPRGYLARNLVEVRLDDITRVGEIIDIAVTSGANSVHSVRFDLKDRETHEREALRRATAAARRRAEAAAAGAGATITRIVRIEEAGRGFPPPIPMPVERLAMSAEARPQTPVIAGEIEVRAAVNLTVAIK